MVAKFIFKKILGWKLVGDLPNNEKKFVIIGAPHTSWHDFYIGMLFKFMVKGRFNFVAKKTLFRFPQGLFFKLLGGIPVDRTKRTNFVDEVVKIFNARKKFRLAISPEGTRDRVKEWKTGFYYIAKQANIPIVMMTFDFGNKQIKVSKPYYVTEDITFDFDYFKSFYKGVVGKSGMI